VAEGRVFVGRKRVTDESEAIRAGDVLEIAARLERVLPAARILARTEDMVAADKPAGIPTIADHAGAAHSLLASVAESLGERISRLHPTSRLDRGVSGVVVFALTAEARLRLAHARARGEYARLYVAIAARSPRVLRGAWSQPIGRAKDPRFRAVGGGGAVPARTLYEVCARTASGEALLAAAPVTGRTHQIRVHAAHADAPLLGDATYGGPRRLTLADGRVLEPGRVALHALRITVPDARGAPWVVTAGVPEVLRDLWSVLGGDPAAWQLCAQCELSSPSEPPRSP
jgi:23S rRNA-/tRNA-specific pseudouridylate synthase